MLLKGFKFCSGPRLASSQSLLRPIKRQHSKTQSTKQTQSRSTFGHLFCNRTCQFMIYGTLISFFLKDTQTRTKILKKLKLTTAPSALYLPVVFIHCTVRNQQKSKNSSSPATNISEHDKNRMSQDSKEEDVTSFAKLFQSRENDEEVTRPQVTEYERKKVLSLAQDHNIHGQLLQSNGLYDEALNEFQRAMEILESSFGRDSVEVSIILVNIGVVHLSKRELEDAEEKFSEALSIRLRHMGEESVLVATVYAYLADVHRIRGDSEESLLCYEKAIKILEELKTKIENTMKMQTEIIEQKNEMDFADEKEKIRSLLTPEEERIQSEIEKKYEDIKRELAKIYNNAGLVYFSEKKYKEAENYFQKAITLYEQMTDYHDDIKYAYKNIVVLYKELHRQFLRTKLRISKYFFQRTPIEHNTSAIQQAETYCSKLLTIMGSSCSSQKSFFVSCGYCGGSDFC